MGVPVTGTITPTDPIDIYATTDPLTGIDSWRSVADHTARNAITSLRRRQGMAVWTQNDGFLWTLNAAPWAFDDTDWTQFSGGGGSPAGSISQVQTNLDGASFGAIGGQGGTTDSVPLGSGCLAFGQQSFAQGLGCKATTDQSVAVGLNCVAGDPPRACTISGTTVTVTGGDYTNFFYGSDPGALVLSGLSGGTGPTIAYADTVSVVYSAPNTVITIAGSVTTHTAGFANMRDDYTQSYAEGSGCTSLGGHAEGNATQVTAAYAHAEGNSTVASANNAHAEGSGSLASGNAAHAEGNTTQATGTSSHAEGELGVASGEASHAEGNTTIASGLYSHAEGGLCTASGIASHAAGYQSIADLKAKVAWGGGMFATLGDCQSSLVVLFADTSDNTPTVMTLRTSPATATIRSGIAYGFRATIVGRKSGGSEVAMFMRSGIIQNVSGTTALVGDVSTIGADNNIPGWAITITADNGSSSLQIQVTGSISTTVHWACSLECTEVG